MKALAIGILVLLMGVAGVVLTMQIIASRPPRPPLVGAMAEFKLRDPPAAVPPGAFTDADGKPHDLSFFKGKITLINIWASWCAPCVEELPSLQRLKKAHDSDKFQVVTISEDTGGKVAVEDYFKRLGVSALPEYVDAEAALAGLLKFDGLPGTILLDANGKELGRFDGKADWAGDDAWKLIDFYVDPPKPAS
jgi:thiol-disulfide isomerase/thioredoxin